MKRNTRHDLIPVTLLFLGLLLCVWPLSRWMAADHGVESADSIPVEATPAARARGVHEVATSGTAVERAPLDACRTEDRRIAGVVLGPAGQAIAGAAVYLGHCEDSPGFRGVDEFLANLGTMRLWARAAPQSIGRGQVARTGADGTFAFPPCSTVALRFVVWHADWQVKFVAATPQAGEPVTVRLRRELRVAGRVLEAGTGRGLKDISVAMYRRGRVAPLITLKTSVAGEFGFPRVAAADYRIMAYGPEHRPGGASIDTGADTYTVVDLAPKPRRGFRLVDGAGIPWTQARLQALGIDTARLSVVLSRTAVAHAFALRCDPGRVQLEFDASTGWVEGAVTIRGPRHLTLWAGHDLLGTAKLASRPRRSVVITPVAPCRRKVRLLVESTVPLSGLDGVLFCATSPFGHRSEIARARIVHGALTFDVPSYRRELDCWLEVRAAQLPARLVACRIPGNGDVTRQIALAPAVRELTVAVRDASGPVPRARVWILDRAGDPASAQAIGSTGTDGRVMITALPEGFVQVVVNHSKGCGGVGAAAADRSVSVVLNPNVPRRVRIRGGIDSGVCLRCLDAAGHTLLDDRLEGRVRHGTNIDMGLPVAAARLEAYPPGQRTAVATTVVPGSGVISL